MNQKTLGKFVGFFLLQFLFLYIIKEEVFLWAGLIILAVYSLMLVGIFIFPTVTKGLFSKEKKIGFFSFICAVLTVAYLNGTLDTLL